MKVTYAWRVALLGATPLVLGLTAAGSSCIPSHDGSSPNQVDVKCMSVGAPFPWEGVSYAFPGGYLVQTGRARIALGMGRYWDSFQATSGGLFDSWYGKGVSYANDAELMTMPDGSVVLNDGGTLITYVKDDTVWGYHAVTWDGSILSFKDGLATIRRGKGLLKFEASGMTANGLAVQVLSDVCVDSECKIKHTVLKHAADGRLQTITDACGKVTVLDWTGKGGRLSSITTPGNKTFTFDYDGNGNPSAQTSPDGKGKGNPPKTTYAFDGQTLVIQRLPAVNAGVPKWTFQFDGKGRFVKYVDEKQRWVSADYTTGSLELKDMWSTTPKQRLTPTADGCALAQEIDALGNVTSYTWTADHKPVSASDWSNKGQDAFRIGTMPDGSDGYDAYGNVLLIALHAGKYKHRYKYDLSVTDETGKPFAAYGIPNEYKGPDEVTVTIDKLTSSPWAWKHIQHAKMTAGGVNGAKPFTDEYNASFDDAAGGQLQIDQWDTATRQRVTMLFNPNNGFPVSSTVSGVTTTVTIPDNCSSIAIADATGTNEQDFDADGALVAAVDQNGSRTVIHRNTAGLADEIDLPDGEKAMVSMADNQTDMEEQHIETADQPGVAQEQVVYKRTNPSDPDQVTEVDEDGFDVEDGVKEYPTN